MNAHEKKATAVNEHENAMFAFARISRTIHAHLHVEEIIMLLFVFRLAPVYVLYERGVLEGMRRW